jgi:predicted lipoprotein
MMRRLILGSAASLAGCTTPTVFDQGALLAALTGQVILPAQREMAASALALSSQIAALCEAPDATKLGATRDAWRAARSAYKRTEAVPFGPIEADDAVIDFWPVREDSVDARLGGADPVDAASLAQAGATVRGLPVLEYLLWTPADDAGVLAALPGRRCAYLRGLGEDLVASTARVAQAWEPEGGDFAGAFSKAGEDTRTYGSRQLAISSLINGQTYAVDGVKAVQLGAPTGRYDEVGTPRPEIAESRYSHTGHVDAAESLVGVRRMYDGAAGLGLTDFVQYQIPDLDGRIRAAHDSAASAVAGLDRGIDQLVVDDSAKVVAAYDAVDALSRLYRLELSVAFGVTITISDRDGD